MKRIIISSGVLSLGLLILILTVVAQSPQPTPGPCCIPPLMSGSHPRFPQGTTVNVYIDSTSGFQGDEALWIQQGIQAWNGQPNYSGITFNVTITATPPPVGTNNTIIVRFIDVSGSPASITMNRSSTPAGEVIYGEMFFRNVIRANFVQSNASFVRERAAHEIGHALGLDNAGNCPMGSTIMNPETFWEDLITPCDNHAINSDPHYPPPPIPNSCPPGTAYNMDAGQCCPDPPPYLDCGNVAPEQGCPYEHQTNCGTTPIIIDISGDGFDLTDVSNGVDFDFDGNSDGMLERLTWTAAGSDDAFLVLDRNSNGLVDSGRELFGNLTSQPANPNRNGFLALAVFDTAAKGGNGDDLITDQDAVYTSLQLWQDINHNGTSETSELHSLSSLGVDSISLSYKESRRTDQYGNVFRYRGKVHGGVSLGRWAYDVYLIKE